MKTKKLQLTTFLLFAVFYYINAQSINIIPAESTPTASLSVTISGENTDFISGSSTCGTITPEDIILRQGPVELNPNDVFVFDDNFLFAEFSLSTSLNPGYYDLLLRKDYGENCELICEDCFLLLTDGEIIEIDPNEGHLGEDLKVTISGNNTYWSQGSPTCGNIDASNIYFMQGSSTIFQPYAVEVLNDESICAWVEIPPDTELGTYDVSIAPELNCGELCEDCFDVLPGPGIMLTAGEYGFQGKDTTLILELDFGDYNICLFDPGNTYLQKGALVITPFNLEIISSTVLSLQATIPMNALLGDYDVVIGEGLGYGCSFICTDCFEVLETVSVPTLPENTLEVFPNPFNDQFSLSSIIMLDNVEIILFDKLGRKVFTQKSLSLQNEQIDLKGLISGVYILQLKSNQGTSTIRLVKR